MVHVNDHGATVKKGTFILLVSGFKRFLIMI